MTRYARPRLTEREVEALIGAVEATCAGPLDGYDEGSVEEAREYAARKRAGAKLRATLREVPEELDLDWERAAAVDAGSWAEVPDLGRVGPTVAAEVLAAAWEAGAIRYPSECEEVRRAR